MERHPTWPSGSNPGAVVLAPQVIDEETSSLLGAPSGQGFPDGEDSFNRGKNP